jgi:hypothetical protein
MQASAALTPEQVAAISPVQIAAYTNADIAALGFNIKYLNNLALAALKTTGYSTDLGNQQVQSITAVQIAVLSPAQIRLIGAAATGSGGVLGTSQIAGAWAALVSDPIQVVAITAPELVTFSNSQIVAIGTNIKYLDNLCLAALKATGSSADAGNQQIQSITAAQISVLSPAQIRLIGAAATGSGGVLGTSQIVYLNAGAWAALVSDPLQVAAITAAEISTMTNLGAERITTLGANIRFLTNAALNALSYMSTWGDNGQIQAISAAQIVTLTPAQVRMIGAVDSNGTITAAKIQWLNAGAWAALVSEPIQVAAITPAEIATMTNLGAERITTLGTNIKFLTNPALNVLSYQSTWGDNGQIQAISAAQIVALTPAQVRMIGATGAGGSITTSLIQWLNTGAWAALVSDPVQVSAITAAEMATLWDWHVAAMGANIQLLSNQALGALTVTTTINAIHPTGQIETLSMEQIAALSSTQIGVLAGISSPYGAGTAIAWLNVGAFGALSATQVAVLTPGQVVGVSAAQMASLSTAAMAGLTSATVASLTVTQKASLTAAQKTACGC